jgi:hypothetical protein
LEIFGSHLLFLSTLAVVGSIVGLVEGWGRAVDWPRCSTDRRGNSLKQSWFQKEPEATRVLA